jgi:uncharacterized membrane protein
MVIRTPPAWVSEHLGALHAPAADTPEAYWGRHAAETPVTIRRIGLRDVGEALARGFDDLGAYRADVVFLCIVYPLVGLLLARAALDADFLPLVFPLMSGFALIGPFAAVGLNEMSRRREMGQEPTWANGFKVFRSPALGRILVLGLILAVLFLVWIGIAHAIYRGTLGPKPPTSLQQFTQDVLYTRAGWTMAAVGIGVGFLFALAAFAISVVSFPMLLDRNVSLETAVGTSLRAVMENPVVLGFWGLVNTAGLVVGSIPALLGLVIVMPVLGHATWHLYRRIVPD